MSDDPTRTADEELIIERTRERRGEEYVEENDELILAQARLIGEL